MSAEPAHLHSVEGNDVTLASMPAMLTAEQAAAVLQEAGWRMGRSAVYDACKRGELDHRRLGRQLRIPRSEIVRYAGIEDRGGGNPRT